MVHVYKLCEKSSNNPSGVIEVENPVNLKKPVLICLTPQGNVEKNTFGIITKGARAARVRTEEELAGGFKLDEMPVDFLGIRADKMENISDFMIYPYLTKEIINYLCDDFIYPYLTQDKSLDSIIKRARMIQFLTYCDATGIYVEFEKRIIKKLNADGFTTDDIKSVLSQIALVCFGSKIDICEVRASTVLFKDVNDTELKDKTSKEVKKIMQKNLANTYITPIGSGGNPLGFFYNGSGLHDWEEYFDDISPAKCSLCAVISRLLENAFSNGFSDEFAPISPSWLRQIVRKYSVNPRQEKMKELDLSLSYGEITRYDESQNICLTQLDFYYNQLQDLNKSSGREDEKRAVLQNIKRLLEKFGDEYIEISRQNANVDSSLDLKSAAPETIIEGHSSSI